MRSESIVDPILRYIALVPHQYQMHSSLGRVKGEDNNMVYAVYRLTHLSSWKFLQHFQTHYPQGKPKVSSPPSVQVQATDDYHAAQQATTQGLSSTVFQEEKTV